MSRAVATYGGPASAAVRGLFIPARGSAEAGDVRAFLRDVAGATDHAAAAGYGLPAGAIGYGLAEFALNPATGLPWDTGDLTGFEYGLVRTEFLSDNASTSSLKRAFSRSSSASP